MQRFIAELSTPIEQAELERSWHCDELLNGKHPMVEFTFDRRRVRCSSIPTDRNDWVYASF